MSRSDASPRRAAGPSRRQARRPPRHQPFRTTLLFVGALLFLFEEWLWNGMTRFFAWLGRFGLLRWLDARLVRVSPVGALLILCVPMALLFPFKIAGLWMIASGRFFTGCLVMLVAKAASTAVIARIFLTCKPQLLRMRWFARLHAWTCMLRDHIHAWMADQPAWSTAKRSVRVARAHLRAWMHGTTYSRSDDPETGRQGALHRWRRSRRARRARATSAALVTRLEAPTKRP